MSLTALDEKGKCFAQSLIEETEALFVHRCKDFSTSELTDS